jgi:capsular exopolysaccharide synthesis family protein
MSRIFDALRRSEGERSENDAENLPEGPELLRRAEHRVTSQLEMLASAREREGANGSGGLDAPDEEAATSSHIAAAILSAERRSVLLSGVKAIPISVPAESRLVCVTDRESPTAEAIRLLGVRLKDLRRLRPLKRVLVTSTIPREGKTTIAANLACALAHGTQDRILLIEGDVRLPALRPIFGIEKAAGITELIEDGRNLQDCIHFLEGAGIWLLPAGRLSRNPLEVLQSQKLPLAMDDLAECFDWIIIDSPPVLPLADTSVWMRLADGILLVTRQGVTERQQLQKGIEALEPKKVLGALLNGSIASAYSDYYYRTSSKSN